MPVRVEVFAAPGCSRCAAVMALLSELAEELGPHRFDWRSVNIAEEADHAVELGVLSTPAIAIDGELVFAALPAREKLREAVVQRLKRAST